MKKIASFTINHDTLTPGMYVSRLDGDCITYDLRMKRPNEGDYLQQAPLHTLEHLVATYVRNAQWADQVVYFGPMGCRTGCYLILRDTVPADDAIALVQDAFRFAADYQGDIPGATRIECGNYLDHDLPGAKKEAAVYANVLAGWQSSQLTYPV